MHALIRTRVQPSRSRVLRYCGFRRASSPSPTTRQGPRRRISKGSSSTLPRYEINCYSFSVSDFKITNITHSRAESVTSSSQILGASARTRGHVAFLHLTNRLNPSLSGNHASALLDRGPSDSAIAGGNSAALYGREPTNRQPCQLLL
jgi:hypothetical protein